MIQIWVLISMYSMHDIHKVNTISVGRVCLFTWVTVSSNLYSGRFHSLGLKCGISCETYEWMNWKQIFGSCLYKHRQKCQYTGLYAPNPSPNKNNTRRLSHFWWKGTSSDLAHPSTTLKTRVLETVLQVEVKNSNMNVVRLYIQIHKHEWSQYELQTSHRLFILFSLVIRQTGQQWRKSLNYS